MTNEEAKEFLITISYKLGNMSIEYLTEKGGEKMREAIKALEQQTCVDAVSREAAVEAIANTNVNGESLGYAVAYDILCDLPSVNPQPKVGRCKNCKYFEYDSMAKVDGVPLIVAHEICSRWGDGCKTKEDGYCFLFEPQESEVRDE